MDNNLNVARQEYFNMIKEKNNIDHTRIEELDIEHVGITLNYQQVDLMKLALMNSKIAYNSYQQSLVDLYDAVTEEGIKKRYLTILEKLKDDEEIPERSKDVLIQLYEQSRDNPKIDTAMMKKIMFAFLSKLSTNLQDTIYKKIKNSCVVEKEGIKKMTMEEALSLYQYVDKDYTSITIDDAGKYSHYVLPSGSFDRTRLKKVLDFAYENDKQVRINALITKENIDENIKKLPKNMIKQKLLTYVDDITKFIGVYNARCTRTDRQLFVRSIDCFNELSSMIYPHKYHKEGWQEFLSLEDLCDVIKVARANLPEVDFVYNETFLEDKRKRKEALLLIGKIREYEEKNNIKLIDTIGTQMHVNLDVTKEAIIDMFEDLAKTKLKVAITEFDVCPSSDMLENNTVEEIEILRERFISDLCNIITGLKLSNKVKFDSVTIWTVSDAQSFMTTIMNKERIEKGLPLYTSVHGGMYDANMKRKDKELKKRGRPKKVKRVNEKGNAETIYIGVIITSLLVIIGIVVYIFLKFV